VSIHAVERFLGERALREGWKIPIAARPSGKRVLVVGGGPGGLSAAYHLRRLGHEVEIREAGPLAGGMLQFGIPEYRLPRSDLIAEIGRIESLGVRIVLNYKVEDVLQEQTADGFDAVFIAIGAELPKRVEIPARDAVKVLDAVALLNAVESGSRPTLGRRVVVYGGGNTAMDAARTVKRLGATETLVVYLRDQPHLEASPFEAAEAVAEGVKIKWLRSIKAITGDDLMVEVMKLDKDGRPQPTGQMETLHADAVVLAIGQEADTAFLRKISEIQQKPDGTVVVGPNMMTGRQGIFAGGDMVSSERTVTNAVGHGKKAARHIDAWLRGSVHEPPPKHSLVDFGMLNLPIFSDVLSTPQQELPVEDRRTGFEEVVAGLDERQALREARRCFSCGNCFECDNCLAACPEDAIVKLGVGKRYRVDLKLCTGCATCVEQCPCHAMEMVEENA